MNTIFKSGEFIDYKGEKHPFMVAGVVASYSNDLYLANIVDEEFEYDEDGNLVYNEDDDPEIIYTLDKLAPIYKVISIGISICNPKDKHNEFIGKKQSEGRAIKYHDRVIALSKGGMCTEDTVKYFVNMTAYNLKENPGLFIKGYNEAAKKYSK